MLSSQCGATHSSISMDLSYPPILRERSPRRGVRILHRQAVPDQTTISQDHETDMLHYLQLIKQPTKVPAVTPTRLLSWSSEIHVSYVIQPQQWISRFHYKREISIYFALTSSGKYIQSLVFILQSIHDVVFLNLFFYENGKRVPGLRDEGQCSRSRSRCDHRYSIR